MNAIYIMNGMNANYGKCERNIVGQMKDSFEDVPFMFFFLKSEKHPPHEFDRVIELRRRGYAVACNACCVSSFSRSKNISIKG